MFPIEINCSVCWICWYPNDNTRILFRGCRTVEPFLSIILKSLSITSCLYISIKPNTYSSFQRQLDMYNFQRITAGKDQGGYQHAHFQRGKPHLCARMIRTRVNGKGCRNPGNPNKEPNLYSLEPLSPITPGTSIEVPDGNLEGGDETDDSAGS